MTKVTLVAVVFPAGDVHLKEFVREGRVGGLLEFFNDGFVGETVVEHVVDLVAEDLGEAGDFAVAAMFGFFCDGFRRGNRC